MKGLTACRISDTGKRLIAFILAAALLILSGCDEKGKSDKGNIPDDLSKYDSSCIVLNGIASSDMKVTFSELRELDSVSRKAKAERSNGERVSVNATGPLLETLMKEYGANLDEYNMVRFNAADGYSIAVTSDIFKNKEIILAYLDDGHPLSDKDGPVRVVVPGERAMYWVRMLESIEFEKNNDSQVADKVIILDTVFDILQTSSEEKVSGDGGKLIRTDALIAKYGNINDNTVRNVYISASDGLSKIEAKDNFLGRYIDFTEEDSPSFTGEDLPEGMSVREILTINYGNTAFFSVGSGLESMGVTKAGDMEGIPFSSLIKKIGSMASDTYLFTDMHGNTKKYIAEELSEAVIGKKGGIVVFSPDGKAGNAFGAAGGKVIEGLLSIEAE